MSKKDKKNSSSINNPFSVLKGLSVSPAQKESQIDPLPTDAPSSDYSAEPVDETDQFEQAMGQLGVNQTAQDDVLEKVVPRSTPIDPSVFVDLSANQDQTLALSRRQIRKLVQRIGEPEATLDLHGVLAADVDRKVGHFLENAVFHGCRSVRIVTGKGVHSAVAPVLRPLVETYLCGPGRKFVIEWTRAPLQQGGAGALLALLRKTDE
jgi:DNA-nicking Smr family endonuclease